MLLLLQLLLLLLQQRPIAARWKKLSTFRSGRLRLETTHINLHTYKQTYNMQKINRRWWCTMDRRDCTSCSLVCVLCVCVCSRGSRSKASPLVKQKKWKQQTNWCQCCPLVLWRRIGRSVGHKRRENAPPAAARPFLLTLPYSYPPAVCRLGHRRLLSACPWQCRWSAAS